MILHFTCLHIFVGTAGKKVKKMQVRCIFGACCNIDHTILGIDDCPEEKKHIGCQKAKCA